MTHFSDNRHHNKVIDGMTVDVGTQFDWSETKNVNVFAEHPMSLNIMQTRTL